MIEQCKLLSKENSEHPNHKIYKITLPAAITSKFLKDI